MASSAEDRQGPRFETTFLKKSSTKNKGGMRSLRSLSPPIGKRKGLESPGRAISFQNFINYF